MLGYVYAGILIVFFSCRPDVKISPAFLPADGMSTGTISVTSKIPFGEATVEGPSGSINSISITGNRQVPGGRLIDFRSTDVPGRVCFVIANESYNITFHDRWLDSDGDGLPDEVELDSESDRMAFRHWFVRIAQAQYLKRNRSWQDSQRDCCGLIRYSYREALKVHDENWFARSGIPVDKNLPDVVKYNYPSVPLVGENVFRVDDRKEGRGKSFGGFCDAKTFVALNVHRIGIEPRDALEGDVLFFLLRHDGKEQYHSMIVVETRPEIVVVYHTGVDDVMKRVPLSYLDDAGPFRPVHWNKRFMGIYRFNILE